MTGVEIGERMSKISEEENVSFGGMYRLIWVNLIPILISIARNEIFEIIFIILKFIFFLINIEMPCLEEVRYGRLWKMPQYCLGVWGCKGSYCVR